MEVETLVVPSTTPVRARPRVLRPGLPALAPGEERYAVPGAGSVTLAVDAGDVLRIVNSEGGQVCEIACFTTDGRLGLSVSFTADRPIKVYSWRGHIYPILGYYLTADARDGA